MNREQRRKLKKTKKLDTSDMENKLGLFDLIPSDCMICHTEFDKTDKKMVSTWSVVVREKQKKVRIYCPICWEKAQTLLSEFGIKDK
tara:strand:+ start:289 stop:549 length:261 start_codon:yes stop_codon:yes gene_type:complete